MNLLSSKQGLYYFTNLNAVTHTNNINCQMCNNSTKRIKLCLSVCLSEILDSPLDDGSLFILRGLYFNGDVFITGVGGQGGTLIFSYIHRLGSFFWVQI